MEFNLPKGDPPATRQPVTDPPLSYTREADDTLRPPGKKPAVPGFFLLFYLGALLWGAAICGYSLVLHPFLLRQTNAGVATMIDLLVLATFGTIIILYFNQLRIVRHLREKKN